MGYAKGIREFASELIDETLKTIAVIGLETSRTDLRLCLKPRSGFRALVAKGRYNPEIRAFLGWYDCQAPDRSLSLTSEDIYIFDLGVGENWRRLKIGTRLIDCVKNELAAAPSHKKRIAMDLDPTNKIGGCFLTANKFRLAKGEIIVKNSGRGKSVKKQRWIFEMKGLPSDYLSPLAVESHFDDCLPTPLMESEEFALV